MKQITLDLERPPVTEEAANSIVSMVQSMKPELTKFRFTVTLTQRKSEMVDGLKYVGDVTKRVSDVVDQIRVHYKLRITRTANWDMNVIGQVVEHFCERTRSGLAKSSVLRISFFNGLYQKIEDTLKIVIDQDIVMIKETNKEVHSRTPELRKLLSMVQTKAAAHFPDYCYGWIGEYHASKCEKVKKIKEIERIILDKRAAPELNLFDISEMSKVPVLKKIKRDEVEEEVKVEATKTFMRNRAFREKMLPIRLDYGHLLLKPGKSGDWQATTVTTLIVCRINLQTALDVIREIAEDHTLYMNQKDPIYRLQTFEESVNQQQDADDTDASDDSYSCPSTSDCSYASLSENELGDPVTKFCKRRLQK